jgi:hypothetical protein
VKPANCETSFRNTGAVEQDRPEQDTNVAPLSEQLDHQFQDPLNKSNDSGLPGHGQTEEFTGETHVENDLNKDTKAPLPKAVEEELRKDDQRMKKMDRPDATDTDQNAQNFNDRAQNQQRDVEEVVDQDPGERQKENQNSKKDDDLAA